MGISADICAISLINKLYDKTIIKVLDLKSEDIPDVVELVDSFTKLYSEYKKYN